MATNRDVLLAHLRVIEVSAAKTRQLAVQRLDDLGLVLDYTMDLRVVANTLTGGAVDPFPNLRRADERLAGMLEWAGRYAHILFEAYDPLVRQRFSIAHEFGHFALHVSEPGSTYGRCAQHRVDTTTDLTEHQTLDIEDEADAFAGAFLVPSANLHVDLATFGRCVAFLAQRYVVSEATIRRRIRTIEQLSL